MTLIKDIASAMEKNKINNTVIKALNNRHGKLILKWFEDNGINTYGSDGTANVSNGSTDCYYGILDGIFSFYEFEDISHCKVIELPTEESKAYEEQSLAFEKPEHYRKGIDTFERMEKNCDLKERMAFIRGSIDAYLWREKGQDIEDFEKIINYSKWALKQLQNQ